MDSNNPSMLITIVCSRGGPLNHTRIESHSQFVLSSRFEALVAKRGTWGDGGQNTAERNRFFSSVTAYHVLLFWHFLGERIWWLHCGCSDELRVAFWFLPWLLLNSGEWGTVSLKAERPTLISVSRKGLQMSFDSKCSALSSADSMSKCQDSINKPCIGSHTVTYPCISVYLYNSKAPPPDL